MSGLGTKQLVILAKALTDGGLCFAARELEGERNWVRISGPDPAFAGGDGPGSAIEKLPSPELLLADPKHLAVKEDQCQYEDGGEANLLDIVEIAFDKPEPDKCKKERENGYQRENLLIKPDARWKKIGALDEDDSMDPFVDKFDLWYEGASSKEGSKNMVPRAYTKDLTDSLRLLKVDHLHIKFYPEKGQMYAHFAHPRTLESYAFHCTDTRMEQQYGRDGPGLDLPGPLYLCVSLSRIHKPSGNAYKLVAGVIQSRNGKLETPPRI